MRARIPHPTTYLQVEILGQAVDLQWLPQRLMEDALGRCHTDLQEIHLRDNLSALQCLDVFLHEIFHYISDAQGLELTEQQVQVLGRAWAQLFQANTELLGFIAERTEEEDERRITRD
ncbi:hypothetical protein UFOVP700_5 [uncultured Caudovirales phage]|uniref:Uncharacterized protein n=1 Tax=uncultured Caudovirales phage TaxID=2100421 RepID=A0A6J5NT58_9CAUD|nr:hypothetical protein UFOVP700_5 [uncultured Caudovirales phage]